MELNQPFSVKSICRNQYDSGCKWMPYCSSLLSSFPFLSLSLSFLLFSLILSPLPLFLSSHVFSSDIDECADGFVECDSKSTCVNLPGWYHCECRDGYHDNGLFSTNGESCVGEWLAFTLIKKYIQKWLKSFIFLGFNGLENAEFYLLC